MMVRLEAALAIPEAPIPPIYRHVGRKGWFHRHRWKRALFEGIGGPIGYHVILKKDYALYEYLFECTVCHVFAITKATGPIEPAEAAVQEIIDQMTRSIPKKEEDHDPT